MCLFLTLHELFFEFAEITAAIGTETNQYAVCVPTGKNLIQDTERGCTASVSPAVVASLSLTLQPRSTVFMTMNDNVDVFAGKIKNDTKLANGFNCVSFSQGAMLCRGYIQK